MREGEIFSGARLRPGTWTVVRLDGRAFTKFTAGRFAKPYDPDFRDAMVDAAAALLEDFGGVYAATHSDEISVVFAPEWEQFGRRVEKIVSVAAGLVSAAFTHAVRQPAHFDARVWQGASELPAWQRSGVGLHWQAREKPGYDPVARSRVTATRRDVKRDFDLPTGDGYGALLASLFEHAGAGVARAA